jgi:hypothetical protein
VNQQMRNKEHVHLACVLSCCLCWLAGGFYDVRACQVPPGYGVYEDKVVACGPCGKGGAHQHCA